MCVCGGWWECDLCMNYSECCTVPLHFLFLFSVLFFVSSLLSNVLSLRLEARNVVLSSSLLVFVMLVFRMWDVSYVRFLVSVVCTCLCMISPVGVSLRLFEFLVLFTVTEGDLVLVVGNFFVGQVSGLLNSIC